MASNSERMLASKQEIENTLREKIIPFWLGRSVDKEFGGYLTSFDPDGAFDGKTDKYIVTQSRMVWGFSHLGRYAREGDRAAVGEAARQGFQFMLDHFWDLKNGGFFWNVRRDGTVEDAAKLVYGESFAIYALSEYSLCFHDKTALEYAEKAFSLLQLYAADTRRGGYYENLEEDWTISPPGAYAGDRKSLDIHMHLMEAFTTLYEASGKEIHRRKLLESIDLIMEHMVNREAGYGFNQFDLSFQSIPAINICRTWNAEREIGESIQEPMDTTSYGHNVELSWLLGRAFGVLGIDGGEYAPVLRRLLDHSLKYGYDYEYGGIYRDGVADQAALVKDKEWWQNFEALVGYLDGYLQYGDETYLRAYLQSWEFVKGKFMNMETGESRQLLDREGNPIVANLGNPWKGIYHTGRALAECVDRLELLCGKGNG